MNDQECRILMFVLIVFILLVFVTIIIYDVNNRLIKIACIEKGNDFITYRESGVTFSYCGDINKVINFMNEVKKIDR
jgi:hypothetical protein